MENEFQKFDRVIVPLRSFSRKNKQGEILNYDIKVEYQKGPIADHSHIKLFEGNKEIGFLTFLDVNNEKFKVKSVRIDDEVIGNDLGIELYEGLISLARQKNFNGIRSDWAVKIPAVAIWKKLQDRGYSLSVNPKAQKEYNEFCEQYEKDKKYINKNGSLRVKDMDNESVFEINL